MQRYRMSAVRRSPPGIRVHRAGVPAALACALLGLAVSASARVFLRERRAHGAVEAGRPGWTLAYAADVRINAGEGRVEVLGVDAYSQEVRGALERAYRDLGMRVFLVGTGEMAWGLAFDDVRVIRLLILALSPGRECLVFRLEQTHDAFRASLDRPRTHQLSALPRPPDGEPRLYVAQEDAGIEIEVSVSTWPARALADQVAASFDAEGWTSLTPRDPHGPAPNGLLYARGERVAAVHIEPVPAAGHSRITRLVQRRRDRPGWGRR